MALGAALAPQTEQLNPSIDGCLGGASLKPTNSSELGQELLSSGPNEGLHLRLGALLAPRSMAKEGRPQKAGSRGSGPATAALKRAWCFG